MDASGEGGCTGAQNLSDASTFRSHLAYAQRVRRLAEEPPPPHTLDAALCPACGRCTSARVCVCGMCMDEAHNLWRSAGATPMAMQPTVQSASLPASEASALEASLREALLVATTTSTNRAMPATIDHNALLARLPGPAPNHGDATCAICLQPMTHSPQRMSRDCQTELVALPCGHVFHRCCISSWWARTPEPLCAICKRDCGTGHVP